MVVIQRAIKDRTPSGGRKKEARRKRLYEKGRKPTLPTVGDKELRSDRTRGGNKKNRQTSNNQVNLYDPKKKKHLKGEIKHVAENPANRHYARSNVLTKGAVIETDKGKAKITNRPGQESTVNATLIEE